MAAKPGDDGLEMATSQYGNDITWDNFPTMASCLNILSRSRVPCQLHNLDLNMTLLGKTDIESLVALLKKRTDICITKLRLAYNALDDDVAPRLLKLMSTCKTLTYLDLSYNSFGDSGGNFIASGCLACKKLRTLYLTHNQLGDDAVGCLTEALRQNLNLRTCKIDENPAVSANSKMVFLEVLKSRPTQAVRRSDTKKKAATSAALKRALARSSSGSETSAVKAASGPSSSRGPPQRTSTQMKRDATRPSSTRPSSASDSETGSGGGASKDSAKKDDKPQPKLNLFHILTLKSFFKQNANRRKAAKKKAGMRRRWHAAARTAVASRSMVSDMHFRQKLLGKLGVRAKSKDGEPLDCVLSAKSQVAMRSLYATNSMFCIFWIPFSCALIVGELAWYGTEPSEETLGIVSWVLPTDAAMASLFLLDVIVGFCTPFNDNFGAVRDPRKVARHYLRSGFITDILICFPWPLLLYFALSTASLHWRWYYIVIVLFRPMKLLDNLNSVESVLRPVVDSVVKLAVGRNDYRAHASAMSTCAYMKHFVYILALLLVAAHILACLWIYTALYITHGPGYAAQNNNWMIESDLINSRVESRYTAAIYWAMTTLTTVGFGDISPTSTGERLLATLTLIVGIAINALFIGRMSVLLLEFTESTTKRRRHNQLMERVCGQYNFPPPLRQRIEQLTAMTFSGNFATTALDMKAFLDKMSPALQMEVLHFIHRKIFDIVPVLRFNSLSFQRSIAVKLQSTLYVQRDYVALYGDPCDAINFLLSGSVGVVTSDGHVTHSLETGSFFGEQGVLSAWSAVQHEHGHDDSGDEGAPVPVRRRKIRIPYGFKVCQEAYTFSVRALSPVCELYVLPFADALELFQLFPAFADSLRVAGKLRTATARASARISKAKHEARRRTAQESAATRKAAAEAAAEIEASRSALERRSTTLNLRTRLTTLTKKNKVHPAPVAGKTAGGRSTEDSNGLDESLSNLERPQTPPPGNKFWTQVVAKPKFIQKYQSLMERSRSIQGALYRPRPRKLDDIMVPWSLERIVRYLAQHVHEAWAKRRLAAGWTWGFELHEEFKRHPGLVPYDAVPITVRRELNDAVVHVIKLLIANGLDIDESNVDSTKLQWQFGHPARRTKRPALPHGRSQSTSEPGVARSFSDIRRRDTWSGSARDLSAAISSRLEKGSGEAKKETKQKPLAESKTQLGEEVNIAELAAKLHLQQLGEMHAQKFGGQKLSKSDEELEAQENLRIRRKVEKEVAAFVYRPRPFPTEGVTLPRDVLSEAAVIEPMAKATHDLWARHQMDQGWTFGPNYDPAKKTNNHLVPYRHLHANEKADTRGTVVTIIKGLLWLGYDFALQFPSMASDDYRSRTRSSSAGSDDDLLVESPRRTDSPRHSGVPKHIEVPQRNRRVYSRQDSQSPITPMGHVRKSPHRKSVGGSVSLDMSLLSSVPSAHRQSLDDVSETTAVLDAVRQLTASLAEIKGNQERLEQKLESRLAKLEPLLTRSKTPSPGPQSTVTENEQLVEEHMVAQEIADRQTAAAAPQIVADGAAMML